MIKIAIVDDEKTFIQTYEKEILSFFNEFAFECEIATYSDSVVLQQENDEKNEYDLVFLDIDMPDISGMQLASELCKNNHHTTIIFVSSHSNFVFEAFRYSAYRFIRKENLNSDTKEAVRSFCASL